MKVVEEYLCQFHGVSKLDDLSVYGQTVPGWALARDVSATVTVDALNKHMSYDRVQPRKKYEGRDIDLERVVPRHIALKYAVNATNSPVIVKLNYTPKHYQKAQQDIDTIVGAISQKIPVGFDSIKSNYDGVQRGKALCESENLLYSNRYFIHTMTLLNRKNMMNGIVHIPNEICLKAGMPMKCTVRKEDNTKTILQFQSYYAVPPDHVFAWTLNMSESMQKRHGIFALQLILDNDRMIYYLVGDACFELIREQCGNSWIPDQSIELKKLSDINVDFYPTAQEPPQLTEKNNVTLTMSVIYTGFPQNIPQEVIDNLAPTLHPKFPDFKRSQRHLNLMYLDQNQRMDKMLIEQNISKK